MNEWLRQNWFKMGVLAAILIVSFSVGYYYFYFLPESERNKIESDKNQQLLQQKMQDDQRVNLNNCLNKIDNDNSTLWNSGKLGYTLTEIKDLRDICFKKYPQK